MYRRTRSALLDIAAELIVSPIAIYSKITQIRGKFAESETGKKTSETLKQAGEDFSSAVKTFTESETGVLIKNTAKKTGDSITETAHKVADSEAVQKVKETAQKIAESDAVLKVKETAQKVSESETAQKVREAAQKVSESAVVTGAKEKIEDIKELLSNNKEGGEKTLPEAAEETVQNAEDKVEDIINDVDFDQFVGKEDEEAVPAPIDEEESSAEFDAVADKLESEINESVEGIFGEEK